MANSVFWNDTVVFGTLISVATTDVVGASVTFSASRRPISGPGCFQLASNPLDANSRPLARSAIVDQADTSSLPFTIQEDLDHRPRLFDDMTRPGSLDMGAYEDRTGRTAEFGCGINPANTLAHVSGQIAINRAFTVRVDDPTGSINSGSLAALAVSTTAPNQGCGTVIPGYGIVPGQGGETLITNLEVLRGAVYLGLPVDLGVGVPNNLDLLGLRFWLQGVFLDPSNGNIGLTRGLAGILGDR